MWSSTDTDVQLDSLSRQTKALETNFKDTEAPQSDVRAEKSKQKLSQWSSVPTVPPLLLG